MEEIEISNWRNFYENHKNFTGIVKVPNESKCWFKDGLVHREDGPAVIHYNGEKYYWLNDNAYSFENWQKEVEKLKQEQENQNNNQMKILKLTQDKPIVPTGFTGIVEWESGSKCYLKNGLLHREDGPARIWPDADDTYWLNNQEYSYNDWKDKVEELKRRKELGNNKSTLKTIKLKSNEYVSDDFTGIIEWSNGNKFWYKNKKLHREDGAAIVRINGTKEYWLNGEIYTYENWQKEIEKISNNNNQPTPKTERKDNRMSNIKETIKSDISNAGYRIAAGKISRLTQEFLVKTLADHLGYKGVAKNNFVSKMNSFFDTKTGEAVISLVIGSLLPLLSDNIPYLGNKIPESVSEKIDKLSEEFRVRAFANVGDQLVSLITGPGFSIFVAGLMSAIGNIPDENKEDNDKEVKIRAEVENYEKQIEECKKELEFLNVQREKVKNNI